jgi:hypothetical protein
MVSYKRHIAKTISWRIIGTLDTIILSGVNNRFSGKSGTSHWRNRSYYKNGHYISLHERAWYKLSKFGVNGKSKT